MNILKKIGSLPGVVVLFIVIITIYLLFKIIVFSTKLFVYLGFNFSVYMDRLLKIESANPIFLWAMIGLFIGALIGVVIAAKKFKLSKLLILYPALAIICFWLIFFLINKPTDVTGSYLPQQPIYNQTVQIPASDYNNRNYIINYDVKARKKPNVKSKTSFVLKAGTVVELVQTTTGANYEEWSLIRFINPKTGYTQTGYVKSAYLNK